MRSAIAAWLLSILLVPLAVLAQEAEESTYNHEAIISDLNALAVYLDKETLTKADVIIVASIACSTMRVAAEERIAERVRLLLNEQYPSEDFVATADFGAFVGFEEKAFRDLGASEQAIALLKRTFEENAFLPTVSPAKRTESGLAPAISGIEQASCDLRSRTPAEPAAAASPEEAEMARQLGMAVVGVSAIVVDATVAVGSGGVGGAVFGIISGGWGWNRCEEAWPAIVKLWGSVFR